MRVRSKIFLLPSYIFNALELLFHTFLGRLWVACLLADNITNSAPTRDEVDAGSELNNTYVNKRFNS